MNSNRVQQRRHDESLHAIDMMKFIAAILVVSIHTYPLTSLNTVLSLAFENTIARIAVPFFFVTSGYFFYSKISGNAMGGKERQGGYFAKYAKRLLLIYASWSLVYCIFDLQDNIRAYGPIAGAAHYAWRLIFVGGHFHLWYFPALLFAIAALYCGSRWLSLKLLLLVGLGLYAIGLFGDSYNGLLGEDTVLQRFYIGFADVFGPTRNGLFFGFVYVTMGALLYERRSLAVNRRPGLFLALSLAALVIEVVGLNAVSVIKDCNMTLMLLPATYFLFQWMAGMRLSERRIDYRILRDGSVLIYCSHALFLLLYERLLGVRFAETDSHWWFLLVLLSSFILSVLIIKLRRNEKAGRYVSFTH